MEANNCFSTNKILELSQFIETNYGIKMPASKKVMLESRLRRRMRQVGYTSIAEYLDFVFSSEGKRHELGNMVDAITTNKTYFFREPKHFDILVAKVIPQIISSGFTPSPLRVWSSACSSGEEPYSIAMMLGELAEDNHRLKFNILASDLCTKVLKKACRAVYNEEEIKDIPLYYRKKYLLKSKESALGLVQVAEHLRNMITFRRINLMADDFGVKKRMHVIFCRNVLIYFQKDQQERLILKFGRQLEPGGFLFIGHSESLVGMNVPFCQVLPTVYQKISEF
ncbi:MAG: protein-glutamate O-methyltransferase CheR [Desulfobulbaceae bacterium]|nr:protein-glutamate O-methyltransferase CheR [Desulfobulbaceae bacterium]HIJ79371.1 protein-glutamate O-methyltransferase CheR [Deltaproteobacteria bacterium]